MSMADPFEFWRSFWQTSPAQTFEQITSAIADSSALAAQIFEVPVFLSPFTTLEQVRLDLPTMQLRESQIEAVQDTTPVLIVAPFAVHDAILADFVSGHSLAQTLLQEGLGPVALTHWKSATSDMRFFALDTYFSDLNVAIDDLGGRAVLVGMCQGGWLAAAFAARFPGKIVALVLAGAPIDVAAAPSNITRGVEAISPSLFEHMISMNGGRASGRAALSLWAGGLRRQFTAADALQSTPDSELEAKFDRWFDTSLDLPGPYFIQITEWLFRENRLARQCFPVLGRLINLQAITVPIFLLAAADDEIVVLPQALAAQTICSGAEVTTRIERGNHLSLFLGRHTLNTAL
eukprot:gene9500-9580_t